MIGGPIGKNVVCFSSLSHSSPYNNNPPYLCFPFVVDDTHIVGLASNVVPIFLRLQHDFSSLRLLVQPTKCIAWFSQG
jgi:hypothetical protein